ncbi:MAG: GntR family transcriptional regulator [Endomicrobiia bacterium]
MMKDSVLPKYKTIAKILSQKIQKGEYKKNTFLPSEAELSKMFKVSRVTIRQALNILIHENLIKPIAGVGSVVINETPSKFSEISVDKTKSIYFVLILSKSVKWGIENPFYAEIISGAEQRVRENGYHLLFTLYEDIRRASDLSDLMIKKHINGFLLVGDMDEKFINLVKKSGLPSVIINNPIGEKYELPTIINDDFRGGFEATKFLYNTGCRKIACIKGPSSSLSCEERYRGYISALKNFGLEVTSNLVVEGNLEFESGYDAVKKIFSSKILPDGIFAINDTMAIGALKFLIEKGVEIPKEISIIGFDNIAQSAQVVPSLTTVNVERKEMGYLATGKLIEFIENKTQYFPIRVILPCRIIERETTRKIEKNSNTKF